MTGPGLGAWRDRPLADLLAAHGLDGAVEHDFPTDGWSGATFTTLEARGRRYVLKRTAWDLDWIARATQDHELREPWFAAVFGDPERRRAMTGDGPPIPMAYLGAARDGTAALAAGGGAASDGDHAAILLPDLSDELLAWDRPDQDPVVDPVSLDRVLIALARLHASDWASRLEGQAAADDMVVPWTPWPERLTLLARPTAERFRDAGNRVGPIFLRGWDAFESFAPAATNDLLRRIWADPTPLYAALETMPAVGIHGDLKLANVALFPDDTIAFIDWQMTMRAPVAVELGWFLVSNSGSLPLPPDAVVERYLAIAADGAGTGRTRDRGGGDGRARRPRRAPRPHLDRRADPARLAQRAGRGRRRDPAVRDARRRRPALVGDRRDRGGHTSTLSRPRSGRPGRGAGTGSTRRPPRPR